MNEFLLISVLLTVFLFTGWLCKSFLSFFYTLINNLHIGVAILLFIFFPPAFVIYLIAWLMLGYINGDNEKQNKVLDN